MLAGALLAVGAGLWLLDRTIEGVLLTQIDAYLRARTLALMHSEEGNALAVELPSLDLSLVRRRLVLRNVRIKYLLNQAQRTQEFDGAAPTITITGVDLSDAIWHRSLRLNGVTIDDAVLRHVDGAPPDSATQPRADADTLPLTLPAADSLLYGVVENWLPEAVRGGRIGTVRVNNATISSTQVRGQLVTVDSSSRLSLTMRGLQLDSARHRIFERANLTLGVFVHAGPDGEDSLLVRAAEVTVTPDDTAFSITEMRTGPRPGRHSLDVHGIRRSHARRMLTIDSLHYAPTTPDSTFFRTAPPRSTRIRLETTDIKVLGLKQENIRRRRVTAGAAWITYANLDVLADRRGPGATKRRGPGPSRRQLLWPARLAALNWVIGTDSALIDSATIRYAEWLHGETRPASVLFDQMRIRLLRATNDSTVPDSQPLVLEGRGRLLGEAPFSATLLVQVNDGPLRMRMDGEVGPMALERVNSWSLPGSGIEVTGGQLDSSRFWFETARGRSRGRFRAQWHDLDLRMVDPVTGKQSLGQKLKSIVARTISRNDNMPDDDGKLAGARIDYEVRPTDTFWGLVWRSLRSGLMRTVKG